MGDFDIHPDVVRSADRTLAVASAPPTVILVAGINGAGKTTSVAKIAGQPFRISELVSAIQKTLEGGK